MKIAWIKQLGSKQMERTIKWKRETFLDYYYYDLMIKSRQREFYIYIKMAH